MFVLTNTHTENETERERDGACGNAGAHVWDFCMQNFALLPGDPRRDWASALTRPTFLYIGDVFDFYEPILICCRNYFHGRLTFNTAFALASTCKWRMLKYLHTHTHTHPHPHRHPHIEFKYGNAGCAISFRFVMPAHWLPAYFWLTAFRVGSAAMQNRQLLW